MLAGGQVGCPKKVNAFVREAGRRPYSSKTLEPPGFHTHLFEQLPLSTYPRILSRVQPARRDLDQCPIGGVPVLLNEQDRGVFTTRIRSERNHGRGSRVPNHLELSRRAVGKTHPVHIQIYDSSSMDSFTIEFHQCPRAWFSAGIAT